MDHLASKAAGRLKCDTKEARSWALVPLTKLLPENHPPPQHTHTHYLIASPRWRFPSVASLSFRCPHVSIAPEMNVSLKGVGVGVVLGGDMRT